MELQSFSQTHAPFHLAETLRHMEIDKTLPRDLPGRYGRAIKDLERLLTAADALAVVAGGWAVWRHGYSGRVTEDVDVVVALEKLERLEQIADVFGFDYFLPPTGRWPKMIHRATRIDVDLLPEAGVPGIPSRPAPVPIGHPSRYQAQAGLLVFMPLAGLIELKLGASRAKDIADLIELIKVHRMELKPILDYLGTIHASYPDRFQALIRQADEER